MKLPWIMEKITNSNYNNFQNLLNASERFSNEQLQKTLDTTLKEWENNKTTLAVLDAKIKFIYSYIDQLKDSISFKNQNPFPIGYFSSFLRLNAAFLYSYLKINRINVQLFNLSEEKDPFKKYIKKNKPNYSLFTLSQFHYIDYLNDVIPFLFHQNIKVIVGGRIFMYDEDLKSEFPNCIFPDSIMELSDLLTQKIDEEPT